MNRLKDGGQRVPPTPPAPSEPPDSLWGRRLEGLSAHADSMLLAAEFNSSGAQNGVCVLCRAERRPEDLLCPHPSQANSTSLPNTINRLYSAATKQEGKISNLKLNSNLVDKLVTESPGGGPPRLVLSLQPQGYTLGALDSASTYTEVAMFNYEDKYLLQCVDSETIPVIWIDLIQELNPELFHDGNVICEIRDYRGTSSSNNSGGAAASSGGAVHRRVLLRPSTLSIICDSLRLGEEALVRAQETVSGGNGSTPSLGRSGIDQQDGGTAGQLDTSLIGGGGGKDSLQIKLSSEEKSNIESQLILALEPSLCLDPNPVVGLIAHKSNQSRLKFSTPRLRRHVHKNYSHAAQNRKRKLENLPAPPEIKIYDFIQNLNNTRYSSAASSGGSQQQPSAAKRRVTPLESLRDHQERSSNILRNAEDILQGTCPPPSCVQGSLHLASPHIRLAPPSQVDVERFARPLTRRPDNIQDMSAQVLEEYILETAERSQPGGGTGAAGSGASGQTRVYHTRLTILQRQATEEYIGELYVERDFKDEERKGSTCRFPLGTKTDALKYINQFTEIFTEEGRKSVEITHKVPGQQPRVTYTPGLKAIMAQQQAANQAAQNAAAAANIAAQNAAAAAAAQTAAATAAAQSVASKKVGEQSQQQSTTAFSQSQQSTPTFSQSQQSTPIFTQSTPNGGKAVVEVSQQPLRQTQTTLTSQVSTQPQPPPFILSKSSDGKYIISQSINSSDFSPQQQHQLISPSPQQHQQLKAPQILLSPQSINPTSQPQQQQIQQRIITTQFQGQQQHHVVISSSGQLGSQTLIVTQAGLAGRTITTNSAGQHILTPSGQIVVSQSPQVLMAHQQQQGQQPTQLLVAQQQPNQQHGGQVLLTAHPQQNSQQQLLLAQQQPSPQQLLIAQQQPSPQQQQVLVQQQSPRQAQLRSPQQHLVLSPSPHNHQITVQHQNKSPGKMTAVEFTQQQEMLAAAARTGSPVAASRLMAVGGGDGGVGSPVQQQHMIHGQTIITSQQNMIPSSAQIVLTQGQLGSCNLVTVSGANKMAPPGTPGHPGTPGTPGHPGTPVHPGTPGHPSPQPSPQHIILSAQSPGGEPSSGGSISKKPTQQQMNAAAAKVARQLVQTSQGQIVHTVNPLQHQQIRPRLMTSLAAQQQPRQQLIRPQHSQVTLVQQQQQLTQQQQQQLHLQQQLGSPQQQLNMTAVSPGRAVLVASPASSTSSNQADQQSVIGVAGGPPSANATINGGGQENQQEAISAIVQMFKSAEAEFEQKTMKHPQHKSSSFQQSSSDNMQLHQTDSSVAIVCTASSGGPSSSIISSSNMDSIASPQQLTLPTVPVPPSSLVGQRLPTGRVTLNLKPNISVQQQQPEVSVVHQQQQQPHIVKVTLSQLAAQLARPVIPSSASLPSYSQAIAASHLNSAPLQSNSFKEPGNSGGTLSLHELLSEERSSSSTSALSAVSPLPVSSTSINSGLLERLMAGNTSSNNGNINISSSHGPTLNLNPLAGQVPSVVPAQLQQQGGAVVVTSISNGSLGATSDDITLAGLLSNPSKSHLHQSSSPTKVSPLLQQLQQPVQPLQSRQYPSSPSPKQQHHHTPGSSPRSSMTSPGRSTARSPRPGMVGSPRQVVSAGGGMSTLQQQLMQPPSAPKYLNPGGQVVTVSHSGPGGSPLRYSSVQPNIVTTTTQSILSAQLSQPPRSSSISLTRTNNPVVVSSSPDIVHVTSQPAQPGLFQMSQGGQIISQGGQIISQGGQIISQGGQILSQGGQILSQGGQILSQGGQIISQGGQILQVTPQSVLHQQLAGGNTNSGIQDGGGGSQQQLQLQPNLQSSQGGLQLQALSAAGGSNIQVQLPQGHQLAQSGGGSMNLVPSNSSQLNGGPGGQQILTLGQVQLMNNQSNLVQLSIPGHNQPYTIHVSLPEGADQGLSNGTISELKTAVAGAAANQGNSTFGRLLSSGGNIFQLQGSPHDTASAQQQQLTAASIKQGLVKQHQQVMVRPSGNVGVSTVSAVGQQQQPNSVLVQMPSGLTGGQQPIRIVRSLPGHIQQQLNSANTLNNHPGGGGIATQVRTVSAIPSPQGSGPATPQTPGVPSPVSVTSPQQAANANAGGIGTPESSPLYVQLQNHGVGGVGVGGPQGDHHFVQLNQKQVNLVNQAGSSTAGQLINNQSLMNQTHLKIRPQRKQSLK